MGAFERTPPSTVTDGESATNFTKDEKMLPGPVTCVLRLVHRTGAEMGFRSTAAHPFPFTHPPLSLPFDDHPQLPVMTELAVIISVHAQFPKNVVLGSELELDPANWEWKKCLAFPVSRLNDLRFSLKPYKWIRYTTGIIIGARGELCIERDSPNPNPIDYNSDLSAVSIDLYYHTADQEKRLMFPIDPNLADTSTLTSSRTSTRRDNFCWDVEDRDENCVLTGDPPVVCEAVHLIPQCTGDTV